MTEKQAENVNATMSPALETPKLELFEDAYTSASPTVRAQIVSQMVGKPHGSDRKLSQR